MRMIFVYLPLVILAIGWLFGRCRLTRAFVCLAVMMVAAEALLITFLATLEPGYLASAFLVAVLGIIVSVVFSFATSRQISPAPVHYVAAGVQQAASVYQGLHPDTKTKVNELARAGARIAGHAATKILREKGYGKSADALRHGLRFI